MQISDGSRLFLGQTGADWPSKPVADWLLSIRSIPRLMLSFGAQIDPKSEAKQILACAPLVMIRLYQ